MLAFTRQKLNREDPAQIRQVKIEGWDGNQWVRVRFNDGIGVVDVRYLFSDQKLSIPVNIKMKPSKPNKLWA